jgi:hypothetical protein
MRLSIFLLYRQNVTKILFSLFGFPEKDIFTPSTGFEPALNRFRNDVSTI